MTIDKVLRIEDLSSLSTDLLVTAYRNGYRIEKLSPHVDKDIASTQWKPLTNEQIKEIKDRINS